MTELPGWLTWAVVWAPVLGLLAGAMVTLVARGLPEQGRLL